MDLPTEIRPLEQGSKMLEGIELVRVLDSEV